MLFLNTFENKSKFDDGPATYLSSNIDIREDDVDRKFQSRDSKRSSNRQSVASEVETFSQGRGRGTRR